MSITASGVGSGLDVESIVQQLMRLERQPLDRLEQQQKSYESELSAFGRVKSALSTFSSAMGKLTAVSAFEKYTTTSADEEVLKATADDGAAKGSYNVIVDNLAEAHKLRTTSGYADGAAFNSGSLTVGVGGDEFTVTVTSSNNTLEGIRDAINDHSGNTGVTASIINDGTNRYLTLTADETGTASAITTAYTEDGTVTGQNSLSAFTTGLTELQPAEDAAIRIDGLPVTSGSNQVTGAIEGVTLQLVAESATAVSVTINKDTEAVKKSVQSFADAYNALRDTLSGLRQKGGDLENDSFVRGIESRISSILNTEAEGLTSSFSYLAEIGVTRDKFGKMNVDSTKLDKALESDFAGVAALFSNDDQGFAYRLQTYAKELLQFDGSLTAKMDGIESRIDSVEDRKESWGYRLDIIEKRFRDQFTALDAAMGQMQVTSDYLTRQLAMF